MEIIINNLTKKLSNTNVLDNINLKLESGKIYGFVGKNGSGKTMLMRAICGLINPTAGEIIIDNKVLGKDISFPDNVGILIENPGFIPSYSGLKNLKYLARIKNKISDEDIKSVISMVGLDPNDKKSYRKYSLGMKQKLGIAGAIMENPNLLILDEPFNALDEETVENIRSIIKSKKDKENIVILSCHDREEIENICDEIIEIKLGKIVKIIGNDKNE